MSTILAQRPATIAIPVVIDRVTEEMLQLEYQEAQWLSEQDYYQNSEY